MNKNLSQARDGRASVSFILDTEHGTLVESGSLAVGDVGFVVAKAATGSAFSTIKVNAPFMAVKSTTLATGDKFLKCKVLFLGQATGKTVTESKNVVDVTIDYDGATNNVTDGTVTKTGSISGSNVTESLQMDSGINLLKSRFDSITEIDEDGTVTQLEANTKEKDNILIIWNARDAKVGDLLECEFIPALFSNLSKGAQYGSSQNFDVDFSGNYSDENGYLGGVYQIVNATGLLPQLIRPVLEDEED